MVTALKVGFYEKAWYLRIRTALLLLLLVLMMLTYLLSYDRSVEK